MKRAIRDYLKGKDRGIGIEADVQLKVKRNQPRHGYAVGEIGMPRIGTADITMPKIKSADITIPRIKSGEISIQKITAREMEVPNIKRVMGKGVGEMPHLKIRAVKTEDIKIRPADTKGISIRGEEFPNIGKIVKKIDAER